jgi:hypothetical protein
MPISVVCSGCQKKLKAPDSASGKRTKCPACQSVIEIPSAGATLANDSWTVKTATGDDFGPVTKGELDQWLKEGRLDDQCQLLQEGAPQWQWASDLFPELAAAASQPVQVAAVDPFGQAAADPFGQAAGMQAQPMGMQPVGQAPNLGAQSFPAQTPTFQTNTTGQSFGSSNPYASTGVAGAPRAGSGDASAGIITIAVFNFVISAMNLLCGVGAAIAAFGGAMLAGSIGRRGVDGADVVGGIWFVLFIVLAIFYFAFGIMLLMGGIGLLKRENWGRILTLICAGLAGLGALFQIVGIAGGNWPNIVGFLLYGGYCVAAFIILLSGGANRAFRKGKR